MLQEIYEFTEKMLNTGGAKAKQEILHEYSDNNLVKEFVKITHDPRIVFGIQMKKLVKAMNIVTVEYPSGNTLQDMLEYVSENNTGSDEVLKTVASYIQAQKEQYQDMLMKIFTKQLKLGVTAKTINKVWGDNFIFQLEVMRSKSYEKEWHKLLDKEVIATIKLDGMRMIVIKEGNHIQAYSRSARIMTGYEHILNEMQEFPDGLYDGELIYAGNEDMKAVDVRQKTASIANTKDGDRSELKYILFDLDLGNKNTYRERRGQLFELTKGKESISVVPKVYEGKEFDKHKNTLMKQVLAVGEEGLMVALADGLYQRKQTDILQKVKPSYSIDLRVKDVYNGLTLNTKDELGGVIVEYKGFPLKVGNGWTEKERKYYYKYPEEIIGKIIEIEHSGESKNKQGGLSVNFPRVVAVREDKDAESYE